jgi:hypothetical protein
MLDVRLAFGVGGGEVTLSRDARNSRSSSVTVVSQPPPRSIFA